MPTDFADPSALADPPPAKPAPRRLEYDRPAGATRRQMNMLLLFVAVNTVLFAAFVCLPTASPFLKQMWEDWHRQRAEKKKAEQTRAVVANCMTHAFPADQLVYAEPPEDATRLLTGSGRTRVVEGIARNTGGGNTLAQSFTLAGWRPPALLARAEPLTGLLNRLPDAATLPAVYADDSFVFLHARKTPAGKQRLIWVSVSAQQQAVNAAPNGNGQEEQSFLINTRRRITAHVFDPADLAAKTHTSITFQEADADRSRVAVIQPRTGGVTQSGRFEPRRLWRLYAAQPDPADPTRFTIPYDIAGQKSAIDAQLNDGDRLLFTPRVGALVAWTGGNEYLWDLTATPKTKPTP